MIPKVPSVVWWSLAMDDELLRLQRERKAAQEALDGVDRPPWLLPLTPWQPIESFNLTPERRAKIKELEARIVELDQTIAAHLGR
jgi:hypothetical protein